MKPSFKHTIKRGTFTNGKEMDYNYVRLAKKTPTLTFNNNFLNKKLGYKAMRENLQTPFKEIYIALIQEILPSEHACILEPQPITKLNIPDFGRHLKNVVKNYFVNTWDSNQKHIVLHSAGYDSRIISIALMELREEKGKNWLGNIHFRCHQPECAMFYKIMEREGWEKSQYSCWEIKEENAFDIGRKDITLNGFVSYVKQLNFWSDIIPLNKEKDWTLIAGINQPFFRDFALKRHEIKPNETTNESMLNALLFNCQTSLVWYGEWEGMWLSRFNDVLLPFFSYQYIKEQITANISKCMWFNNIKNDNIRKAIIDSNNYNINLNDIPYVEQNYLWNISDNRKKQMMDNYYNSLFFEQVAYKAGEINPFTGNIESWDTRIWGFMTVYDKIFE